MILLARVLLYFFSSCISSLSPKSGSNHGRSFAGSLLFSFVAKYPTNFHGKDRTGHNPGLEKVGFSSFLKVSSKMLITRKSTKFHSSNAADVSKR